MRERKVSPAPPEAETAAAKTAPKAACQCAGAPALQMLWIARALYGEPAAVRHLLVGAAGSLQGDDPRRAEILDLAERTQGGPQREYMLERLAALCKGFE